MIGRTILMLILLWKQDAVRSVRLTELRVPADAAEGGSTLLDCHYDMEGDTLYSIKWYKDDREFYRYIPKNESPVYYFTGPGVNVDLARSSNTVVALQNLTQASAGNYRCEVSGEAPQFTTVSKQKYINIQILPQSGLRVTGLQKQYSIDDFIVANCSLPPSRPKATLQWLVNNIAVPPEYIQGPWYRVSAERPDATESILQLSFRADTEHFINGAIKVKCQATIAPAYQTAREYILFIALPFTVTAPTAVSQGVNAYTTPTESILTAVLLPIILIVLVFI